MHRQQVVSGALLLSGLGVLYVTWANAGGLVPPFALCDPVGDPAVHLGENLALVYNSGCTPYRFAHEQFALWTLVGLVTLSGGGYLARKRA